MLLRKSQLPLIKILQTMMNFKIAFLVFSLTFFVSSCSETEVDQGIYPNNEKISKVDGTPKDSMTIFFPKIIKRGKEVFKIEMPEFTGLWHSAILYCADEPVLYNYYRGHDTYRFLWLNSFRQPMVFSLNKFGNKVLLTVKKLDKEPQIEDYDGFVRFPPDSDGNRKPDSTYSRKATRDAKVVLKRTIALSMKEWKEFESLLDGCYFWTTAPYIQSGGLDGSRWTIEGHLKDRYWFVNRWSPKEGIKEAGDYLMRKAGLKEEAVY